MSCVIGIHNGITKVLNNKPWFKYNQGDKKIIILDSPAAKINKKNSMGVAKTVAAFINKAINNGSKVIGDVVYAVKTESGRGIIEITPTKKQIALINADTLAKETALLQEEVDRERDEQYLQENEARERRNGITEEGDSVYLSSDIALSLSDDLNNKKQNEQNLPDSQKPGGENWKDIFGANSTLNKRDRQLHTARRLEKSLMENQFLGEIRKRLERDYNFQHRIIADENMPVLFLQNNILHINSSPRNDLFQDIYDKGIDVQLFANTALYEELIHAIHFNIMKKGDLLGINNEFAASNIENSFTKLYSLQGLKPFQYASELIRMVVQKETQGVTTEEVRKKDVFKAIWNWLYDLFSTSKFQKHRELADKIKTYVLNQNSTYLQTEENTVPSKASTKTLGLVKEAAKRLGIDITTITQENGKKMGINGFADAFAKLVGIVEGTEEKSLPEEVMHVVVALLKQKNPSLYKKMLADITDYVLYREVLAEYGKLKNYQLANGKPDIVKIKEEAVAKLLVEMLILENELSLEKPEKLAKTKSLWNQFKEWFDTFLNKLGLDYKKALLNSFETTSATSLLQDDYTGIVADNGQFFQVAPNAKADEIWNNLQERRKDIQKNEDGYMFKARQMANRVTEVVKKKLDPFSKKEELKDTKFSDAGTAIHADVEDILGRLIDVTTGFKKQNPDRTNIISQAFPDNHVFYNVLYDYMEVMINGYPEGTRFALENMVANEDKSLAGTVDFIAILPTGEIDVVDWKSLQISDFDPMGKIHEKSRYSNEQIKSYVNDILKPKYGVDKIRLARAIPIQTKFNRFGKLDFIRIGDPKVEDETVDFLLPITTELEETQDDKINKLVKKLQTVYNSISERPALNKDYKAKKEQLKSLFAAIQQIKLKKDFKEVHNQFEIMSFSASKQIEAIEDIISTNKELSKEEMNKLSENLLKIKAEFHLIKDLDNDLVRTLPEETEEDKFLKTSLLASMSKIRSLVEDLDEAINNITAFYVKQETGIDGLLKPEVGQKSFFMKIRVLSRIQTRAAQALTKMIQRSQRRIEQDITDFYEKFKKVATGLTKEDVSLLLKKDKNKSVNKLIDQYRYKDFEKAFEVVLKKAEESKNLNLAVQWVKDNIDVEKFKEEIEKERDKDIAGVEAFKYFSDPERDRAEKDLKIQKIKDYSDFNKEFVWLNTKNNLRYPAEKWQTEEYNKLKANPKAFEFYTLVRKVNKKANKIGYLHYSQTKTFLPWIEKSKMEALADGDFKAIPELLLSNLSVAVRDGQYGSQNKITGEIEDVVPKYFTSEIENFSDDIVKNFQVFAQQVINYEHKSEAEHAVKLLLEVERNKESLEVSGGVLTGNLIPNNKDNADIIADSIKNYYYGQKYTDANGLSVNVTLGKGYNSVVKAINKKLGTSIPEISESESTKQLSVVKILDSLTNAFTLKTLGIKPTTGLVNFLGTSAQAHINAGTWYTKTQHLQQETVGVRDKFVSAETELALFKLFNPSGIDEIRRKLDKLSNKNVNKYNYDDVLMILMRKPEEFLRYVNFKAFLKNAIVINGQLVNARVYYRNSPVYKNRYKNGTTKQLESGFEAEVAKLIETNGLSKFVEVKNDKAIINANPESVDDYITLTKTVGARNSGSIQPGDNMQAKMNIWTNSFLVFKTWIPSLMDQRFGDFKYDANTDTYEYGRVRSFAKILVEDYKNAYSNFKNIYEGNAEGVAFLENQWQKRKEAYYNETGHELDESLKEQYFDLIRQNLKNIMTEMLAILTLFSMVIGASFIPPEDEEESNSYKLFVRSLDRLKGELMFFYNPVDFEHFVNGNLFPAFGMLTDLTRLLNNFMLEAFGTVFQNEEWVDKAKPIKYTMKLIPGANASLEYLPIFLPEWSQEAGIVIKKEIAQ